MQRDLSFTEEMTGHKTLGWLTLNTKFLMLQILIFSLTTRVTKAKPDKKKTIKEDETALHNIVHYKSLHHNLIMMMALTFILHQEHLRYIFHSVFNDPHICRSTE